MQANHGKFHDYLSSLPDLDVSRGTNFNQAIPGFVNSLGYDMENVFFDITFEPSAPDTWIRQVDAGIKLDITSPIWMTITTDYIPDGYDYDWSQISHFDFRSLKDIQQTTNAQYSVALSNRRIAFHSGFEVGGTTLSCIDQIDSKAIFEELQSPDELPEERNDARKKELEKFHKSHLRHQHRDLSISINTDKYVIDLGDFWDGFQNVKSAETAGEKGDSLEELASLLFGGFPFITVREKNLRTSSAEIDLVLEYLPPNFPTVFDDFGRFILVECKNWSSSVGADAVRDFKGKMDSAKVDFGIIVASNGISGKSGRDAVDEINQYFQREDTIIIVIDETDLENLLVGKSLYEIIDRKVFNRRFRLFV